MKSRVFNGILIVTMLISLQACSLKSINRLLSKGNSPTLVAPTPTPTPIPTIAGPVTYPFTADDFHFGLTSLRNEKNTGFVKELNVSAVGDEPHVIWYMLESEPGKYNWSALDGSIASIQAQRNDVVVLITPMNIFGEPRQELDQVLRLYRQDNQYTDMSETFMAYLHDTLLSNRWPLHPNKDTQPIWINFVKALVDRYDGDGKNDMPGLKYAIRNWQFDDQYPLIGWGDNDIQAYLSVLTPTYQVIKATDPQATVVLAGLDSSEARLFAFADGYIEDNTAGFWREDKHPRKYIMATPILKDEKEKYEALISQGKDAYDVVDIHLLEEKETFIDGKLEWVKQLLDRSGIHKPIWCIEAGGPQLFPPEMKTNPANLFYGTWSSQTNAEYTVKIMVTAAYRGIDRIYFRLMDNKINDYVKGPWTVTGLVDANRYKKPSYYAYQLSLQKLKGFSDVQLVNFAPYRLVTFTVGDKKIYVAWAASENQAYDLSSTLGKGNYTLTKIVTALEKNNNPIVPPVETAASTDIPLSTIPVFIEKGGS